MAVGIGLVVETHQPLNISRRVDRLFQEMCVLIDRAPSVRVVEGERAEPRGYGEGIRVRGGVLWIIGSSQVALDLAIEVRKARHAERDSRELDPCTRDCSAVEVHLVVT